MEDLSVPVLSATFGDLCFANHCGRLPAPDRDTGAERWCCCSVHQRAVREAPPTTAPPAIYPPARAAPAQDLKAAGVVAATDDLHNRPETHRAAQGQRDTDAW